MGSALAHYEGIKAFSETDHTDDLKAITVPVLVMQGDDDQLVPYKDASLLQAKLVKNAILKIYPGFPHSMMTTHADVINADILAFIKRAAVKAARRPSFRWRQFEMLGSSERLTFPGEKAVKRDVAQSSKIN